MFLFIYLFIYFFFFWGGAFDIPLYSVTTPSDWLSNLTQATNGKGYGGDPPPSPDKNLTPTNPLTHPTRPLTAVYGENNFNRSKDENVVIFLRRNILFIICETIPNA